MPMRQLRTCDFCGDDAAGVYEVLPPELSPTEAEQRRVVLCTDCLETLEGVLDPLLARLGVGRSDEDTPDRPVTPAASSGAADSPESAPGQGPQSGADTADSSDTADTDAASGSEADGDTASVTETDPGSDDASWEDVEPTPLGDDESASSMPDAATNGTADPDAEANADSDADIDADVVSPTERSPDTATASDSSATDEEPEEFRTVMRLLGNREFPVPRAEVVELAAGAYDLEESHVERILDYAIERDLLTDDGGTLRKA